MLSKIDEISTDIGDDCSETKFSPLWPCGMCNWPIPFGPALVLYRSSIFGLAALALARVDAEKTVAQTYS